MTSIHGRPMHLVGAGCVLGRRGGRLVAHREGKLQASAPFALVSEVIVLGNVTVTTPAIHGMLTHDIPLVLLSATGRPLGRLEPPAAPHVEARLRQLDLHRDPVARLSVARRIVAGKVHNQAVLLRRRARRSLDPDQMWHAVSRLAAVEAEAARAGTLGRLLGLEGAAAGIYFAALRRSVIGEFGFTRRDRNDGDIVNLLVNYCSALLRETVTSAILAAGLDPYLSFLHTPARGRPTLAFDLMEEWRPVLVESVVVGLLGLRRVTTADIRTEPDFADSAVGPTRPLLSRAARIATVERFQARLAAPARGWPAPPTRSSYADLIAARARELRRWLLEPADPYVPFRWR